MRFFRTAIFAKTDEESGIKPGIFAFLEVYGRERLVRPIY